MHIDINGYIFLAFIIANFGFGLYSSWGVNTIRSYAIGDKDFSTATLVSTLVATWIGGSFFVTIVSQSYANGIIYIAPTLAGNIVVFILIAKYFAPRMAEFLDKLSVAEAMGNLFGRHVRIITATAGFIGVSGIIAIQLQIAGLLFQYAFGMPDFYGIIVAGLIVTIYSSLGGIKSVTLTDVVQFCTFGIIIPTLAYFLFDKIDSNQAVVDTLTTNPLFDLKSAFTLQNPKIYHAISIFLWMAIPSFNPAIFQRIAMAKNVKQVHDSFIISAVVTSLFAIIICWMGVLLIAKYPGINTDDIFKFIVVDSVWVTGFKGILFAGIMAMIMSTVDSYINSSAVLLVHDLQKSFNVAFFRNELLTTRICSMFVGLLAILFAMRSGSFLELMIWASTFYVPIVTVPFTMAVCGFRSSNKSVLLAMAAGFSAAMIWELFFKWGGVGGLIPGMLANLVTLLLAHRFLRQPGGWVGIADPAPLLEVQKLRQEKRAKFWYSIKNFNLLKTLKKSTPTDDGFIAILGIFIMMSNFSAVSALPKEVRMNYTYLINCLFPLTLGMSSSLISYPLWLWQWREREILPYVWNLVIFSVLVCFSFFTVLLSKFAGVPLMVFMVNIIVVFSLIRWRLALVFMVLGVSLTFVCHKLFVPLYHVDTSASLEFRILYLLLLVSGVLVLFLKPKEEHLEKTEHEVEDLKTKVTYLDHELEEYGEKVSHYSQRVADQQKEIDRLGETAQRILNNVNHELRLPVGNVMNFAEMLSENLEKYDSKQLKMLSEEVFKNSNRLSTMILNMLDLATLDVKKVDLNKTTTNLSELVEERVKECHKIYLQGKRIRFKLMIAPEILLSVDVNYMRQTVDNLVINAINFSEEGLITVKLERQENRIVFTISDQGRGIAASEIYDIFTPFKMGSNTESKAEGRGVGLALCRSVIEAHGGSIAAESSGEGASFRFVLSKQ